jgi:hypothetical protein
MGYKDKDFQRKRQKNPQGKRAALSIKKLKQAERAKKVISNLGKFKEHLVTYGIISGGGNTMDKIVIIIKVIKPIREYHLRVRKESTRRLKVKVMQGERGGKRGVLGCILILGIKCAK